MAPVTAAQQCSEGVQGTLTQDGRIAGRVVVQATKDPSQRIVITGMGGVTCFGNDVDTFYDRHAARCRRTQARGGTRFAPRTVVCRLLEGTSGVAPITRFDATTFPTNFAAQIRDFDSEGCAVVQAGRLPAHCAGLSCLRCC